MPITINLDGPQGNVFALMGFAKSIGRQLGWDQKRIDDVKEDMMSSDYNHAVEVFKRHFGDLVVLEGGEDDGDDWDDEDDED